MAGPGAPEGARRCRSRYLAGAGASAVVGSMTALISSTRSAGKPPWRACSRTSSAFGALQDQGRSKDLCELGGCKEPPRVPKYYQRPDGAAM